ncbi:sigma-70 family RNA polymerase sigma factor [Nicoliella lavandulae]|uniref:Sigma-70 family RNA polymerase sigma factor n=1 Tax=Nicoliella lavandulae TaxID=3082954 RepID=A0ABU8SJX9_9LACO
MATSHSPIIVKETKLIREIQSGNEDAIGTLFKKYIPVVNRIWNQYFINGMDKEDWHQESMIVLVKIVKNYDCDRGVSFGSFYRQALKNRFFDLIRRKNAKKRLPDKIVSSFDAYENYYSETVVDMKSFCPERRMLVNEQVESFLDRLSMFETLVLLQMLRETGLKDLIEKEKYSKAKIINAVERCRRKFNAYQNEMNG